MKFNPHIPTSSKEEVMSMDTTHSVCESCPQTDSKTEKDILLIPIAKMLLWMVHHVFSFMHSFIQDCFGI